MNINKTEIGAITSEICDELFNASNGYSVARLHQIHADGSEGGRLVRCYVERRVNRAIRLHLAESRVKNRRRRTKSKQ